ncbi:MAG: acyltransferase [Planctomycetes bacterium]|nr:acyltransferase [Planctomycetota bacterium]
MKRFFWGLYVMWLRKRGPKAAARAVLYCNEKLRLHILRAFGASIGPGTHIRTPMHIMGRYEDFAHIEIGAHTYIGPDCLFDLCDDITIGDRAAVSARCSFVTHMNVGAGSLADVYPSTTGKVSVGDDTWLGVSTTVLMNASIGRSCVIAAGAVVNRDVNDGTLAGGVPVREIKRLTDSEVVTET